MALFRIDVLNSAGTQVGSGPLTSVMNVKLTRSLDRIGGVEFSLPATDAKNAICGAGKKYRIYHRDYGLLGTFTHSSQTTGISGNTPVLKIKAADDLISLARQSLKFRYNISNSDAATAIAALITGGGFTASVSDVTGNITASFEGESRLAAIGSIAERLGYHYRLNGTTTVEFGAFGNDSGIRLSRVDSLPTEIENNANLALVTDLSIITDGENIVNRIIPVGAGVGATQLTLEYVTAPVTGYAVQSGTNADGSTYYYIEDTTSQTDYGIIEYVLERNDIRQLTNSLTNLQNAANALYTVALTSLLRYKDPHTTYQVSVTKLNPASINVGDTVRLQYRGIVNRDGVAYKFVDIDSNLFVQDVSETWTEDGRQDVNLTIGTSADRAAGDIDILTKMAQDAKIAKTHVQPSITKDRVGPYIIGMDSAHNAKFTFEIGDETQALNYAFLRFKTGHLKGNVGTVSGSSTSSGNSEVEEPGASSEITSGTGDTHYHSIIIREDSGASGHTPVYLDVTESAGRRLRAYIGSDVGVETSGEGGHTHGIEHTHSIDHTHTFTPELTTSYGFYEDTDYPDHISVWIDDSDRTLALYGAATLDKGGTGITGQTVEITQYLEDQSSLRSTHTVEFRCAGGQGEIEAELVMLMTVQAIAVS